MLERNVLIIDDNPHIKDIYIPIYLNRINLLKSRSDKWSTYRFTLDHCPSMKLAIDYLADPNNYVDVLVVDYDFNGEKPFINGTAFVKYVREKINRYCQIVFYSMQAIKDIDAAEWVALVNSDVFKYVDKSRDDSILADAIFEAATLRNPIVESLERFWCKYEALLRTYNYTYDHRQITFEEIINHIRMDDEIGRDFVQKLMQKAIILSTEVRGE